MRAPFLRFIFARSPLAIGLGLWISLAAQAQPVADAAIPDAPSAPLPYQALPTPQPLASLPEGTRWRLANDAVAAFPRGHADIAAWEARQSAHGEAAPIPTRTDAGHEGRGDTR